MHIGHKMSSKNRPYKGGVFQSKKASVLIVVLLLTVVVMSVLLLLFRGVTERRKLEGLRADRMRCQLALDSGIAEAAAKILRYKNKPGDWTILVPGDGEGEEGSRYFSGVYYNEEEETFLYEGLFSGGSVLEGKDFYMPSEKEFFMGAGKDGWTTVNGMRVPWEVLERVDDVGSDKGSVNIIRSGRQVEYAYWVEELDGKMDWRMHGWLGKWGERSEALDLCGLWREGDLRETNVSPEESERDQRLAEKMQKMGEYYFWPELWIQDENTEEKRMLKKALKESVLRLVSDGREEIVPFGLGYADQGKEKFKIWREKKKWKPDGGNGGTEDFEFIEPVKWVTQFCEWMNRNLPKFRTRSSDTKYLEKLGVNIVDYVDSDDQATVLEYPDGVLVRGVEGHPYVTEYYRSYHYMRTWKAGEEYWVEVVVTPYVGLWNLWDKEITGVGWIQDWSGDQVEAGIYRWKFLTDWLHSGKPVTVLDFRGENAMKANEFRVVCLEAQVFQFPVGPFPLAGKMLWMHGSASEGGYQLGWSGIVVDRPGVGMESMSRVLERGSDADWSGGSPGLRHSNYVSAGNFARSGDPRMNWEMPDVVAAVDYDKRSRWWGPADQGLVKPHRLRVEEWGDVLPGLGVSGVRPLNDRETPDSPRIFALKPATRMDRSPGRINQSGRMHSIRELGNIYDPLRYRPGAGKGGEQFEHRTQMDLRGGGGNTLRMGRPEHKALRGEESEPAWKMLDLLQVGDDKYTEMDVIESGKVAEKRREIFLINVNTASRAVLRVLFAHGIWGWSGGEVVEQKRVLNKKVDVDAIVAGIIESRPFRSMGELASAKWRGMPVFGSEALWQTQENMFSCHDEDREKHFFDGYELGDVTGKNFRIHVRARVVGRDGRLRAQLGVEVDVGYTEEIVEGGDGEIKKAGALVWGSVRMRQPEE